MKWLNRISLMALCTVTFVILLYGIWLICRAFLFDQFVIPSDSMRPTLIPGDRVIVDKTIMGARIYTSLDFVPNGGELKCWRTRGRRPIKHNDVAVFNFPHHDWRISFIINNVFCKRCIALPGDSVWTENGQYKNNNYKGTLGVEKEQQLFASLPDSIIPRETLNTFPFDEHFNYTTKNLPHIYVPRKGDVIPLTPYEATYYRMILEWETGRTITWNWKENKVFADGKPLKRHTFTHNYYFMAGDHVMDSSDSRYWGLVPEEYIVGVVTRISYSKDRKTGRLITERTWKKIETNIE